MAAKFLTKRSLLVLVAEVLLQNEEQLNNLLKTKLLIINRSVSSSSKCLILLMWISLFIQLATVLRICSS